MQQFNQNQFDEQADKGPIALRMVSEKPHAPFDQAFADKLQQNLRAQIPPQHRPQKSFIINTMNKLMYAIGGALVVVIVIAVVFINRPLNFSGPMSDQTSDLFGKGLVVKSVAENSFGQLSNLTFATAARGGDNATNTETAVPLTTKDAPVAREQSGGGSPASDMAIFPPYVPTQYIFEYTGAPVQNLSAEQPVYKRLRGFSDTGITGSILERLRLGLLDIAKFQDAKLQNISVVEDREYGYSLNVSMEDGSANIYENWNRWPIYTKMACFEGNCPPYEPVKPEEVPSDNELIAMANAFVAEYGINLDAYGAPVVEQNEWRILLERSARPADVYIPEVMSVVYPLRVEGQDVFDEGGYRTGMHVSINIRAKRVSSVYDLTAQQYEKSDYAGETEVARIMKLAEQGGFRYYPYYEDNAQKVTVKLGTPTQQLMRFWRYTDNRNDELLIPALFFPIVNRDDMPEYFQKFVIVPLVRSILDEADQEPRPIPVDLPAAVQSTPPATPDPAINHPESAE